MWEAIAGGFTPAEMSYLASIRAKVILDDGRTATLVYWPSPDPDRGVRRVKLLDSGGHWFSVPVGRVIGVDASTIDLLYGRRSDTMTV